MMNLENSVSECAKRSVVSDIGDRRIICTFVVSISPCFSRKTNRPSSVESTERSQRKSVARFFRARTNTLADLHFNGSKLKSSRREGKVPR